MSAQAPPVTAGSNVDKQVAMALIHLDPIGAVRSPIPDPSRDEYWGGIVSTVELDPSAIDSDATAGLDQFSHIQVVYCFHLVDADQVERSSRHPKGRQDWPSVGILAQRAKRRPNRIGVSTCRLLKVDGLKLTVEDLDAIDGSPVIDVKPYMTGFGPRGEVREPEWAKELMSTYFAKLEKG
jgi:tRNA-Thr(GGU) m(6)t(6)A37 methyltransferase TsaA